MAFVWMTILAIPARGDDFSWISGNGSFYNAANWAPFGIPTAADTIRIGNLGGIQNSTVTMGGQLVQGFSFLEVSSGMTLDTNGTELVSFAPVNIMGNNSRIIARPQALGPNVHDFQAILNVGTGARFELTNNVSTRLFAGSQSSGDIHGRGSILIDSHVPFVNNGTIRPTNNGGLTITQGNGLGTLHAIDLDGTTNNGHLFLFQQFSVLQVNASQLTDSFSGKISFAPGALLTMNITNGWTADANSLITANGIGNPVNVAQINGSPWTFGGTMNVGGNQGRLRVLSDLTYAPSAIVNVGATDGLQMTGTTVVEGGQFNMGQGALLQFDGPTTVMGGEFNTASQNVVDGFVAFNGPTHWRGSTMINGVARQNGTATVNAPLGGVINADLFDMDGASNNTTWNINTNLVVNADRISTAVDNRFAGTMNIGGGFTGKLTMNLGGEVPSRWIMAGEMNLTGLAAAEFPIDRLAGSGVRISGDVNVNHRSRVAADTEFLAGSSLHFASPSSLVQFTGDTWVSGATSVTGMGTLENGFSGSMILGDGLMLEQAGLHNRGALQIGYAPGVVSVDRFQNFDSGIWSVDIGGLLAGTEHDLMIVGGGQAFLDGMLEVRLVDLGLGAGTFIPQIGETFTILASLGGVQGTFVNNPVTTLGPQSFHWDVIYNPHDVQVRLAAIGVPEPSGAIVLVLAWIGSMLRRRQRRNAAEMDDRTNENAVQENQSKERLNCVESVTWMTLLSRPHPTRAVLWRVAGKGLVGMCLFVLFAVAPTVDAQPIHWNAGSGQWSNPGNWAPVGLPWAGSQVFIGGMPGVENIAVTAANDVHVNSLVISHGNLLQNVNNLISVAGNTTITGGAGLTISDHALPGAAGFETHNLFLVGENSRLTNIGSTIRIHNVMNIGEGSRIYSFTNASGSFDLMGAGTTLINDGWIGQGPGFRQIRQMNGGMFDLDGVNNNGVITVASATADAATLSILHGGLTDSFSGTIYLGNNSILNMEVGAWTLDENSTLRTFDISQTTARLMGDQVTMAGTVDVHFSHAGSQFEVYSDAILAPTVNYYQHVDTSTQFLGATTHIQGGDYRVRRGAQLIFDGNTTISGGDFLMDGPAIHQGVLMFNGATHWNGTVNIAGSARQIGNATTHGATINANLLDMSGNGGTAWNINGLTTINAGQIDVSGNNVFTGSMNIGGGFLSRLTLNLNDPNAHWTMAGQMNLSGVAMDPFPIDRLSGSAVRMEGDLHVAHHVRVAAPLTFASGSSTHYATPDARLQTSLFSRVEAGATFSGGGTLENGIFGEMVLNHGAVLGDVNLVNHGLLQIGDIAGVATVHSFENSNTGIWHVDIGGYLGGLEHDRLLVSGPGGAVLDGMLSVDLVNLGGGQFLPTIGDEFSIIFSFGGVSGAFLANPVSHVNGQSFFWEAIYNPHDVRLRLVGISAIPEPSAVILVALLMGVVGCRRRVR